MQVQADLYETVCTTNGKTRVIRVFTYYYYYNRPTTAVVLSTLWDTVSGISLFIYFYRLITVEHSTRLAYQNGPNNVWVFHKEHTNDIKNTVPQEANRKVGTIHEKDEMESLLLPEP